MKIVLKLSIAIMALLVISLASCTKESNDELLKQQTEIATSDTPQFRAAKECQDGCCWESCGGFLSGCHCSNFTSSPYRIEVSGLDSATTEVRLKTPYINLNLCSSNIITANGTYFINLDTERFNLDTEASEKEGVQWRVFLNVFDSPFPLNPVTVKITPLDNTCTDTQTKIFTLDYDNNDATYNAVEFFCLQCTYQDVVPVTKD